MGNIFLLASAALLELLKAIIEYAWPKYKQHNSALGDLPKMRVCHTNLLVARRNYREARKFEDVDNGTVTLTGTPGMHLVMDSNLLKGSRAPFPLRLLKKAGTYRRCQSDCILMDRGR